MNEQSDRNRPPCISVIIPTHNRVGTLTRAMESVLHQTFDDLELIVVDDGSTDATRECVAEMNDQRLRFIRRNRRGGVSAARNEGLRAARGRLIALLDSDDEFLPTKLEVQRREMLRNGWDICQTEEIWVRRGVRVNPMRKHAKPAGRFFLRALDMCLVSPSCVMFSRAYAEDMSDDGRLFDESLPACEDYDLWLRTLQRYDIGLAPQALTIKHGGGADQLSRSIVGLDLYRIRALIKLLKSGSLSAEQRAPALTALERKTRVYVGGCLKRGRLEEAGRVVAMTAAARAEFGKAEG